MQRSLFIWVAVIFCAHPLFADDFFSSSPGALSKSHASIDGADNCNDCHTGGKGLSNQKCLGCHDHSDLKKRIAAGKGFHASSKVRGKSCQTCHTEHRGRGYDIMGWKNVGGQKRFNHDLTGWPLEGKHIAVKCEKCHTKRNRQGLRVFLGTNKLCGSCHKNDQPHGFERKAMLDCQRCHTQSVWKPPKRTMKFNHNKKSDAAMPLQGAHDAVSCAKCHPSAKFNLGKRDPEYCGNCHKSTHGKHLFGAKKCQWCHSPKYRTLAKTSFNHSRRTRFSLGAHEKLDCYQCHKKSMGKRKPDRACQSCHGKENPHRDRFKQFGSPPSCATCHPTTSWKRNDFNHDKRTRFKLRGKHADAKCRDCHRGSKPYSFEKFNPKKVGCMGCHVHKNVHDGKHTDKQCLTCHKTPGTRQQTGKARDAYHGPKSNFPLVKGHKRVKCSKCHPNNRFESVPSTCGHCHKDSLHKGSLGSTCNKCHYPGIFKPATRFDHDDDTKWPLKGLHRRGPKCVDCHPKRDYSNTPTNCGAGPCHGEDDAHKGRLGNGCEKCHTETGANIFNHNRMSRFKLDGSHLYVKCSDCHADVKFKPMKTNCFSCHPEPRVHKGKFGTQCETCHTTKTFGDIKPLHDVGDFALRGAHDNISCDRCHKNNRPLQGMGNLCTTCHRQDDIHSNTLSPRCGRCHTQYSFAPARFNHSNVGCNLFGQHRTLDCVECHKGGNFAGISPTCVSCHRGEAASKGGAHNNYTTCSNCHNTETWAGATGASLGRESICR